MDWKERLTAEKSLFQVYWKARRIASSRWNGRTAWVVFLGLSLALGTNAYFGQPIVPYAALVSGIREVADIGFSLTTAILGFLIAGFAVFASITKPDVFVLLAKLTHTKGGISRLHFMFFNFLLVFIHFLFFLAMSIFIKLMFHQGGPLSDGIQRIFAMSPKYTPYALSTVFAFFAAWLVFLLMLLKSFIWNLYQSVLVTIGVEAEMIEQRHKQQTGRK
jgi:hypothetical protein